MYLSEHMSLLHWEYIVAIYLLWLHKFNYYVVTCDSYKCFCDVDSNTHALVWFGDEGQYGVIPHSQIVNAPALKDGDTIKVI